MAKRSFLAILLLCVALVCARAQTTNTYNGAGASIPETGTGTPYPSTINVSDFPAGSTVSEVSIKLNSLSHYCLQDLFMALVGPNGETLAIFGGIAFGIQDCSTPWTGTITLRDSATEEMTGVPVSGHTYKPRVEQSVIMPTVCTATECPAPAPYSNKTLATQFTGVTANGAWKLYIYDYTSVPPDGGSLASWDLTIAATVPSVATATVVASSSAGSQSWTGDSVTFTAAVTSGGSPVTSGSVTFKEGVTILSGPTALDGFGQATFTTTALAEGRHTITAEYGGATGYDASNGQVVQSVDDTTTVTGARFCNPGSHTLPASGTAAAYPLRAYVSGVTQLISTMTVSLGALTYPAPNALQMMLVGPDGTAAKSLDFFSHTANASAVTSADLAFTDTAASTAPTGIQLAPDSYQPTSTSAANTWAAPAPSGPYQFAAPAGAHTFSSVFNGGSANGWWSLYIASIGGGSSGSMGQFCIEFGVPDLTINKSHSGDFYQGQTGALYSIRVTNEGTGPSSGLVNVTDTLPSGLTATSLTGTDWSCTLATLTCTRSDALAPGVSYNDIALTVNVAANAAASVTNSVTVAGGGDSGGGSATDPTDIIAIADLTVAKTHTGDFSQGQTGATYTITVTNNGTGATSGQVTLYETIQSGLTATGISGSGWTCALGTLTCTRNDVLAAGASYPAIILTVDVAHNAAALITNSVTVSGGGESNTSNNIANDPTTIVGSPDLTVAKAHVGNFRQGQTSAIYTITVSNVGRGATTAQMTVADTLPAGLTATAMSGTDWSCTLGATPACTRTAALAGSGSSVITLTVDVASNAGASLANTVAVSGGGQTNTGNDTASDATTVDQAADLQVAKSHSGDFTQGQTGAQYSITVSNTGPGPTVGQVSVTDSLPAGLTATGFSGTGWSCVLGTLTCTRSDVLNAGNSYPALMLTVNVASNAAASVTNSVIVSGGGELNTSNNSAGDPTTVIELPDLAVTKTHTGHFTRGQTSMYTITVSNAGSAATSGNVTVTDTLPAGLTATAISGTGWSCTLTPLSCARSDALATGESYPPIILTVNVATDASTPLANTVTVSGASDVNPGNNTATDVTTVLVIPEITWAAPAAINYGTALSAAQLNASSTAPGAFAYSPAAGTILATGPHTLNVTFTPTDPNVYAPATATVNLTVNKATPTITWTDPAPIMYGTALSATQLNATTGVPGSFVYSPTADTVLATGSHTLNVTFTPTDTANYNGATASVTQVVNKAAPTITWTSPAPITYGTALSATQLNATTGVPGSFVYSPTAGTVLATGSHTLNVTFTPTDTANYNGATASVTQVVSKAAPAITWATPPAITYGTALSATQLNADAGMPGSYVYSPPAGAVLPAGNNTLNVTFTPTDADNYANAAASVTLAVNKSTPTVTWATPAAITYGTALSATQLNADAGMPGAYVYSPLAGTVLPAGNNTLSVTFTPTDTDNYNNVTASVTLPVNKAAITVNWATPAAISYGTALSATQLNATASVPGSYAYSPAAGTVLATGSHTLNVTLTPTDTNNYNDATASVMLVVNKATPVVAWATPAAITYGTVLGPAQLNATAGVDGTFAYSPAGGAALTAGSHTLNATFTAADSANYNNATASVTQVVNKATPTITWPAPAPITPGTPLGPAQLNATSSTAGTFVYSPAATTLLPAGAHVLNVTFTPTDSANYNNASASVTQVVNEKGQAIYFPPIRDRWYRDTPVVLAATASSGLPVSYAVVSGPATVSGSALAITGPGRITVRASQGGSADWEPAENVEQSFVAGYRTEVRAAHGATVWVDDAAVVGGSAFIWEPGTMHRIAVLAFQSQMPGSGYRFASWSDGGAREHTITAAAADATYTASIVLQFELTVKVQPDPAAGTVVPGTGFFDAGTTVALEARPNAGYHFVGYSGDIDGSNAAMTGPRSVTATFAAGPKLDAVVDSASFRPGPLTSGGLFTAFGSGLGASTLAITDSAGVERLATVLHASVTQVNFISPEGLAPGPAVLRYTGAGGVSATLALEVAAVAPGLFSAKMDGRGAPAGQVLRVNAAGQVVFSGALARCGAAAGSCECEPIDLGSSTDQVFVVLYGTGFRSYSSMRAIVGGVEAEITWAGAQPTIPGLDQINLRLPRVLAGRGEVELTITVDGRTTNVLELEIR